MSTMLEQRSTRALFRIVPPPLIAGALLVGTVYSAAINFVYDDANTVFWLSLVLIGAGIVAWSAYREADFTGVLSAAVLGAVHAVLYGWILVISNVAFTLFFGDLLGVTETLAEETRGGDLRTRETVMFMMTVYTIGGVLLGPPLGLLGWVFSPLRPFARRRAPPA